MLKERRLKVAEQESFAKNEITELYRELLYNHNRFMVDFDVEFIGSNKFKVLDNLFKIRADGIITAIVGDDVFRTKESILDQCNKSIKSSLFLLAFLMLALSTLFFLFILNGNLLGFICVPVMVAIIKKFKSLYIMYHT